MMNSNLTIFILFDKIKYKTTYINFKSKIFLIKKIYKKII